MKTIACKRCKNFHGYMQTQDRAIIYDYCCNLDILSNKVNHVRKKRCPNFSLRDRLKQSSQKQGGKS